MRVSLEKAFVLHRRPYSNTSLIVEFFTEQYGRVAVLARSARGMKSRYRGKLEPFTLMQISWSGKGELKTLGNVDFSYAPHFLEGEALACGFYLNEILMRLLQREDPYKVLFEHYHKTLAQLQEIKSREVALRLFEKNLLQELGFGLSFDTEYGSKKPIQENAYYQYVPDHGFLQSEQQGEGEALVFSGASLLALQHETLDEVTVLKEAKRLMRLALYAHLGVQPLKSRELF